jgi:carbon-monoxide dehydrogenase large subunit
LGQYGIGQPVAREEDPYLLRGEGRYVDDVTSDGQLRGYVLRSPLAHAKINGIDTSAAEAAPGVRLILTGNTPEVLALGLQRPMMQRKRRDGSDAPTLAQPHLARDRVRYVGDYVAFVVADTVAQAKDAAEMIMVDYEELPAVVGTAQAVEPGAPQIWDEAPGNEFFVHQAGDKAATDAAFEKADHVISHRMVINRITTNSMEPRGCLAEYDTRDDRYIVRCTVQAPHRIRAILASQVFKLPENKFRVISDNMGGGFGMKGGCYPEYILSMVASKMLRKPVKWISERSEGLLSDEQARDNVTEAALALDKNGKFLGLRVKTIAASGAYYNSERAAGPAVGNIGVLAGTYTTPAIHVDVTGVATNTMLTAHYRGAGRPEAAYVIETLVDMAARELKMDPAELRRMNTIPVDAMPFKTALVYTYDCGDFEKNLDECMKIADYAGFPARREAAKARGMLRGIGVSNTIEASNAGMIETAEIRFDASGTLTLFMGTHDHGQGHGTTFKQMLSGMLGMDTDDMRFVYGDTDQVQSGTGTFGSRSAACGGTAVKMAADKIVERGKKIAAHLLEAAETDIEFADGAFSVAGTDRTISMSDVAKAAFQPARLGGDIEPGLYETATYNGGIFTFPNGCHIAEIEIDPATGVTEIVKYSVVDDVGTIINPLLVKGQIHGGIAQGVGQALMEDIIVDPDSGQVMTGSFLDYCMPRADDLCSYEIGSNVVPTPTNPLGVKGAGEAGTVGSLAAIMNAVNDALAQIGAEYVQMPATAQKVWAAIEVAKGAEAA